MLFLLVVIVRPLSLVTHARPSAGARGLEPIAVLIGHDNGGIEHYLLAGVAAVALYICTYCAASHCHSNRAIALVLAVATACAVAMLATFPAGSDDLYTNIIDGRMAWLHHLNPMIVTPRAAATDPLFPTVLWRDEPSYYGPAWYLLLLVPTRLVTSDFVANLVAFRAVLLPFLLGSAYLAARIARRRAPRYGAAAAVFVGLSPLLLWEIAGNGHNDIVMAFFALFAVERAQQHDWAAALPLLALSILTKYTTVVLLPLFLVAALRGDGRRAIKPVLVGGLVAGALSGLVFARFWAGSSTFDALLHSGANRMTASPAMLLAVFLHGGQPLPLLPISASVDMQNAQRITAALFAVVWLVIAVRLWWERADLLTSCFYSLFFYQMLVAWWFFPGYLCLVVVFGAALVPRRAALLALLFSSCGLFAHVVQGWGDVLFTSYTTDATLAGTGAVVAIVFLPALAYWLAGLPRPRWLAAALGPLPEP